MSHLILIQEHMTYCMLQSFLCWEEEVLFILFPACALVFVNNAHSAGTDCHVPYLVDVGVTCQSSFLRWIGCWDLVDVYYTGLSICYEWTSRNSNCNGMGAWTTRNRWRSTCKLENFNLWETYVMCLLDEYQWNHVLPMYLAHFLHVWNLT